MLKQFKNHIENNFSFLKKSKLLIAVSGGIDSVVLANLCYSLNLNVALAHCNFNLRQDESDDDEKFVLQLANSLDLEVFVESFDTETYAKENKRSIQMAARELRYNWFDELTEQLQFDYILTAHHADDNLETFLINFTRGTGLEGLIGIPAINGNIVRPLLPFSRTLIEVYAKNESLQWREDSSNASTKYLRNKLRHNVIPVLKELNPSLLQSFQTTLENLKDSKDIVDDKISDLIGEGVITLTSSGFKLNIAKIKSQNNPKAYLYRFLNEYGFTEWKDAVNLLNAQSGKYIQSNSWRLIKDRAYLLLSPIQKGDEDSITISENEIKKETPIGTLFFEEVKTMSKAVANQIYVDKEKLKFPLTLRRKQVGDVFYPLGMRGKKKLSKYFKDEKLSLLEKENTWLLCSADNIIWVINRRADDRFKITKNTKHILKIELK